MPDYFEPTDLKQDALQDLLEIFLYAAPSKPHPPGYKGENMKERAPPTTHRRTKYQDLMK